MRLTESEMRQKILNFIQEKGSIASAAREIGVTAVYLSDVSHAKRPLGNKIPLHFGYHRVEYWEELGDEH